MSKRKVAIFTGNRAEYGLQYPIIKAVNEHPDLQYLVDGNAVHESCYYSKLGELVESNPLGHPRRYSS